ncbi:MAG TPA: TetR/AcrR family transcriptional regulator [Rhodanobacteraceae bacterium]|nr:TetR/AcrR family transcriptional regulator [Rhodanobacteraceae bacterium]
MSQTIRAHGPGRPKDLEKRAAVLDAAKRLFVELGYAGTSMDAVASAAGVSKLTVYSHFGDKDSLFREAVRLRCQEMLPERLYQAHAADGLREDLLAIARRHAELMCCPETIGMWRAISSDCQNGSPRLGRLLWEEGPQRTHTLFEQFLRHYVSTGELEIHDVALATSQFMALLKGDLHARRMLGLVDNDCPDFARAIVANAEAAVDMFLRAYAPR